MERHECWQLRRLFIIERDATAEMAKRKEHEERVYKSLASISKELGGLSDNMSREFQSLHKEIINLSKLIKKSNN